MSDFNWGCLIGTLTAVLAFFLLLRFGPMPTELQARMIEAGCGHYDAKTGEFVMSAK